MRAGGEDGLKHPQAAVNVANCLLRLGRNAEARERYAFLAPLLEEKGAHLDAARVSAALCIADWNDRHDRSIRARVTEAIKKFERNLPGTADLQSLYSLKKFNEPALMLLLTILTKSQDGTDDWIDDVLSVLWALQEADLTANLEREVSNQRGWDAILVKQLRRRQIVKSMLEPFPDTRVVHLCPAIDDLVLVAYGYLDDQFRLETMLLGSSGVGNIRRIAELMDQQHVADVCRDRARLDSIGAELAATGDAVGAEISSGIAELIRSGTHLFYMPSPYGSVDLFPLGALRFKGKWLAETHTITRMPTPNLLREWLAPTRPSVSSNHIARVVTGDPGTGPARLRILEEEGASAINALSVIGFDAALVPDATVSDLRTILDGGAGCVHYIGHGTISSVFEGLPLRSAEMLTPTDFADLSGYTTGFVFLSACEAGSVRHGGGGYQTGIASKLVERGAPAVVAFTHPVIEERAGRVAREFYRQASKSPFGAAVRAAQEALAKDVPAYTWLSVAAYGDPEIMLPGLAGIGRVGGSFERARTWHSALRIYAALRTDESQHDALAALGSAPTDLRPMVRELIMLGFADPPVLAESQLAVIDSAALAHSESAIGALSLHATVVLARAHWVGLDSSPIRFPEPGAATSQLFEDIGSVGKVAASVFDTRLNGLVCALLGRLIAWDQGNLRQGDTLMVQALESLREASRLSPFLARMRDETQRILEQFGET